MYSYRIVSKPYPVAAVAGSLDVKALMTVAFGYLFRDLLGDALVFPRDRYRQVRASRRGAGRAIERLGSHECHEVVEVHEAVLVAAECLRHRHQLEALRRKFCHRIICNSITSNLWHPICLFIMRKLCMFILRISQITLKNINRQINNQKQQ